MRVLAACSLGGAGHLQPLLPFLAAARRGLVRSRWLPGMNADDLLAPIVLAVLVEVAKQLRISELEAAVNA